MMNSKIDGATMTDADILLEEHFKRRETRAQQIYQTYFQTCREIWLTQQQVARAVLFGEPDDEKKFEEQTELLKQQFFIKTGHEFDEIDKALS